jgi:SpoVK/Ycf46/Vps4 family AAA+-type ATPase
LKSWGLIRVDLMTPFEPDASIVDRLVIDENQRILLRHLALGQRELPASRQRIADEPGRLLLFSGKPGTGKTSLAKACAALCRRPLITLSGAELARSTSSAESTISDYSVSARALGAQILIEDVELCLEGTGGHHGPGNPSLAGVAKIAAVVEELTAGGSLTYLTTRRPHMLDPALFGDILLSVKLGEPEGDARRRMWSQVHAPRSLPQRR